MKTLYINDKMITIFDNADFFREMEDAMGIEAVDYIKGQIEELEKQADFNEVKKNTDIDSYEADLDSNKNAFEEIESVCRTMIQDFNEETGRNKLNALRPWRNKVENILKIIDQQY